MPADFDLLGYRANFIRSVPLVVDRIRGDPIVAAASGLAEEVVRLLILLLVVGRAFSSALWVGLGWGATAALWALVSGAAILALIGRDPEAEQARSLLTSEEPNAPLWGVLGQIWATLLHIGYTLLIAASPILVIFTVVAHSTTSVLLLRWGPIVGLARLQALGFVWTAAILAQAWLAWALLGR